MNRKIDVHLPNESHNDFCDRVGEGQSCADRFKIAMRGAAASVTIVTTVESGVPHGMTATAVTSLSLDPPSLVICVNRKASIHGPLLRSGSFCVNFLRQDHSRLSADFSGQKPGGIRFSAGNWMITKSEPPMLVDGQASIFCAIDHHFLYGTHTVIIGRVARVHIGEDEDMEPLLHHNAGYGRFATLRDRDS